MADLVETLKTSRQHLLARADGLSQHEVSQRPAAEEWSVIEVLAHIADVDRFYLSEALAMRDHPATTSPTSMTGAGNETTQTSVCCT